MNSGTLADEPPAKKACVEESLDESDAASEIDDKFQSDDGWQSDWESTDDEESDDLDHDYAP